MREENGTENPEAGAESAAAEATAAEVRAEPDLGKFKSVDALARAYKELEAEFTRRSQKLKALEDAKTQKGEAGAVREDELYRMVNENEGVRARVLSDYLSSLKGVPLLANSGVGVTAERAVPKTFGEAGAMALSYLKKNKE